MKETGSKEDFQNYKRAQQQAKKVVRNAPKSMRKILQKISRKIQKLFTHTFLRIQNPKVGWTSQEW